jgi:hypothetical protein
MELAERGAIQWIVVSERDRFGTVDADEFVHFRYLLRKWGCRLLDANGTDWTKKDIATVITAVVDGEKSEREQHSISARVLGGMVERARQGEWLGGAVRLGFDIACFHRETKTELWRVVLEGRDLRLKVFPDGRSERFDGKGNFPPFQGGKKNAYREYLQLVPSQDQSKVQAAVNVFARYAVESISFSALAHHLNALGIRSCYGQEFESRSVQDMLADPIYLGYASWNKTSAAKFHRYTDGQPTLEINLSQRQSKNKRDDWVQSKRLFKPLVTLEVWNAVLDKLANRQTRAKAPNSHRHFLTGLLTCANCGSGMTSGRNDHGRQDRVEYQCGSYTKAVRYKGQKKVWPCRCLRNGVFQVDLERFISRYLEETGRRLEVMLGQGETDHLDGQYWDVHHQMNAAMDRLQSYLERYAPNEYKDATRAWTVEHPAAWDVWVYDKDYVQACLDCYRRTFNPARVAADLAKLDAEHNRLMEKCERMPTKLAVAKVKAELEQVEAKMDSLRRQQTDASAVVEAQLRELSAMQDAIGKARQTLQADNAERAVRQKAEAVRRVIARIDCTFTATGVEANKSGRRGGGWGKRSSELVRVTIYPLIGEEVTYNAKSVVPLAGGETDSNAESVVPLAGGSPPPNDTALTPCAAQSPTNDTSSSAVQRVSPSGRLWL